MIHVGLIDGIGTHNEELERHDSVQTDGIEEQIRRELYHLEGNGHGLLCKRLHPAIVVSRESHT